ncbi:hypothetical protein PTTG_03820 [Puccinia triticina 1-1 BBBD Race 1]|uniref:No apical meristem-associated C-terminal domain-containing protein n=1 Tax=Puccinia triticina (isolate 1-1 / race 1 (BBBD)) TaxID=630390 RepID=A0A0C4ESP1_PUCT1|nr:hypothetical protein PTTG_03820 [Puccinia triticina 1-1 BBBD Race 1]
MPRRKKQPSNITPGDEDDGEVQTDNNIASNNHEDIDPNLTPNKSQAAQGEEKKKGPSYTKPEDYKLCQAWVQVSEDPSVGTDQDGNTFWERVLIVYHKAIPNPIQPVASLKKQWSNNLQPSINKFRGCVNSSTRVVRLLRTS